MITNCSITLYNKYIDKTTSKDMYKRTVIQKAMWQGHEESSMSTTETGKGVLSKINDVNISIPISSNDFGNKAYIEPKKWLKLVDSERDKFFTFQETDRVIKGECDFIPTSTLLITELSKYDNAISIMSIKVNDYGSKVLQHFKLGGK